MTLAVETYKASITMSQQSQYYTKLMRFNKNKPFVKATDLLKLHPPEVRTSITN